VRECEKQKALSVECHTGGQEQRASDTFPGVSVLFVLGLHKEPGGKVGGLGLQK
jgi:hypothetical protein